MTKLSIVLIVACSIAHGISSSAELLDAPQPQDDRANLDDQDLEAERAGGRASAQSSASAQGGFRPGANPGPNPGPILPATRCYTCADCPKMQLNVTSKFCPRSFDPARNGKCVVYTEKYNHMDKPWMIRGCASERGSCAEIQTAHAQQVGLVKLLSCKECAGDLCNTSGSVRSAPSFLIASLAMLVTPFLAKKLLA